MARRGRDLRGEPVAARRERHLGRNRRWAGARDAGRRQDVDERDAAGAARLGQGVADRRRPLRREHRLHRDQRDPPRRHAPAHLPHARRRPHLDAHRQRHQPDRVRSTSSAKIRGSRDCCSPAPSARSCSRQTMAQRWQSLRMNMPASSVRDLVIKDDDLVIGTHGRSIWILDNIAPLRQIAEASRAKERVPVHAAARDARAREHVLRHAVAAGGADRREPAGRRDPRLLPAARREERHAGDRGRQTARSSADTRARDEPERIDPSDAAVPDLLDSPAPAAPDDGGTPSVRVGPALRAAARGAAHARDRRGLPEDAERSRRTVRPPRVVHGAPHRGRCGPAAAARRAARSARDDRARRICGATPTPRSRAIARYHELQDIREAIDARPPDARKPLLALRGTGEPDDQDVLYGSITAVPPERETIVGLQEKFLFMLTLLQGADARPTPQALAAIAELQKTLAAVKARWDASRLP